MMIPTKASATAAMVKSVGATKRRDDVTACEVTAGAGALSSGVCGDWSIATGSVDSARPSDGKSKGIRYSEDAGAGSGAGVFLRCREAFGRSPSDLTADLAGVLALPLAFFLGRT